MLPPPACWKSGSMRPSGAHGSYSRLRGGLSPKGSTSNSNFRKQVCLTPVKLRPHAVTIRDACVRRPGVIVGLGADRA